MSQPIDTAYVEILPDVDRFERLLKNELDAVFKNLGKTATKSFRDIENAADDAGKEIDISITRNVRRAENALDSLADAAERAVDRLEDLADVTVEIGHAGIRQFDGLAGSANKFGESLAGIGTSIGSPAGLVQFGAIITGLALLIAPITALAAALADVAGIVAALPAAVGVLAATIAPLVIGFQNFGTAIEAIQKGDPEKIAEAMGKLAPAAAAVAREFQRVLPQFQALQRLVQQQLFAPLQGALTNLTGALLPSLRTGLGSVAAALGNLGAQFAGFLSSPAFVQVLNETFATTARILNDLSGPLLRVFGALNSAVHESLPFVERIARAFGRALDEFAAFLNKAIETGEFDQFLEDALKSIGELVDLGKALGDLLATVFGATDDAGRDFLGTLTDLVTRLDEFFESAEGQETIANSIQTIKALGAALGFLVNAFVEVNAFLVDTLDFFDRLGNDVGSAADSVGDFFSKIGDFLASVPGKVGEFLSSLPQVFADSFQQAIDRALFVLGLGIGLILSSVTEVPKKFLSILQELPQKATDGLATLGPRLTELFDTALSEAGAFLRTKFNEIVDFITNVPERLGELKDRFKQAGLNLITSFAQGFRTVGSFIGDVAGDIVGAVKSFLNRAIGKINEGIGEIDKFLPGDLPRIPRLAEGALVRHRPGGILANIGEGREDEVVAPLSKLDDMVGGQQITIGPITVVFEGAVPTEDEAFRTGRATGDGIAAAMAQRGIRMEVRAI